MLKRNEARGYMPNQGAFGTSVSQTRRLEGALSLLQHPSACAAPGLVAACCQDVFLPSMQHLTLSKAGDLEVLAPGWPQQERVLLPSCLPVAEAAHASPFFLSKYAHRGGVHVDNFVSMTSPWAGGHTLQPPGRIRWRRRHICRPA